METLIQILGILAVVVVGFLALTPVFLRLVVVKEGNYVSFLYLGRHSFRAFELTGYCFDTLGFIAPGVGPNSLGECWCIWKFGGWVFYLKWLVVPVQYRDKNEDDGFGDGVYVHLNEMQQELALDKEETAPPENVALDVKYIMVIRIVNPYLYLFMAPKDAKQQIANSIDAIMRGWVRAGNEKHAQDAKGNGPKLWIELVNNVGPDALNCQPIFDKRRNEWGVEILKDSIVVSNINYDKEYQDALKAKSQQELQAIAFAASTSGAEISMISKWTGKGIADLQAEVQTAIVADPEHGFENWLKKYPIVQKNWNLIQQKQLGVRPTLFGNADGSALDPLTATLAALFTVARGAGNSTGNTGVGSPSTEMLPPLPPLTP